MENDINIRTPPPPPPISNVPKTPKSLRKPSDEHNCNLEDIEGSNSQISSCMIPHLKFSKTVTTDDIVSTDADLIDFDSFKYVNKESLVKTLIYFIKGVDQVNKDLSSVSLKNKVDFSCQVSNEDISPACSTNCQVGAECSLPKDVSSNEVNVDQLNFILSNFQSRLLESVDEKLAKVDEKVLDAISKLPSFNPELIIESVSKVVEDNITKATNAPNTPQTYASTLAKDVSESIDTQVYIGNKTVIEASSLANSEVIILSNSEGTSCSSVDDVKKAVSEKFKKVPFDFANAKSKSKKIAIRFHDKKAKDQGVEILNASNLLTPLGYSYESANKLLPKITLSGIPRLILTNIDQTDLSINDLRAKEKEAVLTEILDKNPCIFDLVQKGHTFQIVFLSKFDNVFSTDITVGIKVSPSIRAAILNDQSGYIFLAGKRVMFKDRFHIKQCYHCQLIGHISTDCPEKNNNPTCLYCMNSHRSSTCTFKQTADKHCCAKCHASKNPDDVANYMNHNSASLDCPVAVRECSRLANITDFTSKNVM